MLFEFDHLQYSRRGRKSFSQKMSKRSRLEMVLNIRIAKLHIMGVTRRKGCKVMEAICGFEVNSIQSFHNQLKFDSDFA